MHVYGGKGRIRLWKNGLWLSCFVLALMAPGVVTGATEEEVRMETVVVTATRIERKTERVPANVTIIDQKDIVNSNAKNAADLLRSAEGIVVRDLLGNGKTAQVDLRGFGESSPYNTLVLVDGRRVNEMDLSGVDWTQIPLEQIERIEVVRGTGSVLYGDNAVGGVINIITKVPSQTFQTTAGVSIGSYDYHKETFSVSGTRGKLGGSLFADYQETDGYRDNNEFRARDVGGKIFFDPTECLSLNLSGSYHRDDYGLPSSLTAEEMSRDRKSSVAPYDEAETRDRYLRLNVELDLKGYGNVVSDVSYRDQKAEDDFVLYTYAANSDADTWSVTPRYIWDGEIFNHDNTLIAGVDLYWSEQDGKSFYGTPLDPSGKSSVEKDTVGLYFRNEFSLLSRLILSFGARRERAEYDLKQRDLSAFFPLAPLDDTVTERESAYTGGITFLYGDGSSLFARVNRSFRFPLTDELIVFDYLSGEILVNQDLKPQTGKHYETGIRHFFTPDIEANLTLFRAEIENEIFFNPETFTNSNHPETLHHGIEIGGQAGLFEKLTLYGNFTYIKATFEKEPFKNKDVPAVPRYRANAGFRIHDLVPGLAFSADYNYVGSSYAISDQANTYEKLDSYYTVNARLSYAWKNLRAFVGGNNLTDQKYSEYAAVGGFPVALKFLPAPERNWVGGIEVAF